MKAKLNLRPFRPLTISDAHLQPLSVERAVTQTYISSYPKGKIFSYKDNFEVNQKISLSN